MANFDEKSKEYDAWYETPIGAFVDARETEAALSICPRDLGYHLLDAGCGTGRFSLKMALLGHQVTGIDLSQPMLAYAREKAAFAEMPLTFHAMNIYDLDFPDNHFDGVVSMALFEFIQDDQRALAELFRVLKPGGYLMIGTITKDSAWGMQYLRQSVRPDSVFHEANFKTAKEMASYYPKRLLAQQDAVYVPPNAEGDALTLENEVRLSKTETGAFTCLLWQKPLDNY